MLFHRKKTMNVRLHSHRLLWVQWIYTRGKSKSTVPCWVQNHQPRFKVNHWPIRSGQEWPWLPQVSWHITITVYQFRKIAYDLCHYFYLSHRNSTYVLEKSQCMAIEVLSFSAGIKSRNNVDRLHQIFMNLHVHSVVIWTYSDTSQYCFRMVKYFEFDL